MRAKKKSLHTLLKHLKIFNLPIAICAFLLVALGFKPIQAAMLCLLANGASGVNKGVLQQPLLKG